ncbi:CoA binding domain-containing protein [Chaetomium strumarium]|uniref:CoA binding domain-containing protein n=1 Tax=Chaetomium strumarium TaxID=1170767 RepID=A0AAJ0GWJ9_9PEZI|nr:CoA binding domain-containing protein [Chaetomium strumarium]
MHRLRRLITHAHPAFPSPSSAALPQRRVFHRTVQRHSRSAATMTASDSTLRDFFKSPKYAVVGASTNTEKFGYKVFRWYVTHNLPATPVNPGAKAIEVDGRAYPTVSSLSELAGAEDTSVSVITPPHVTLKTLEEAKQLGIQSVFLQPGTFNDEVLAFARENFRTVLAGDGGWGSEGWCVLVDGERGLKSAGKL